MKYYSQFQQDEYLNENVFKGKADGYFVDIGAYDGIHCSNSYFFEQQGWTGVCVEPIKVLYDDLIKNRKCKCIEGVVSDRDDDEVVFCQIDGYCEMLSGILDEYDDRHKARIFYEQQAHGGDRKKVKVKNYKFGDVVEQTTIDILDIDTEGNEKKILQSIDFDKYLVSVILVENNYKDSELSDYILSCGFSFDKELGCDEVYINKKFAYE